MKGRPRLQGGEVFITGDQHWQARWCHCWVTVRRSARCRVICRFSYYVGWPFVKPVLRPPNIYIPGLRKDISFVFCLFILNNFLLYCFYWNLVFWAFFGCCFWKMTFSNDWSTRSLSRSSVCGGDEYCFSVSYLCLSVWFALTGLRLCFCIWEKQINKNCSCSGGLGLKVLRDQSQKEEVGSERGCTKCCLWN